MRNTVAILLIIFLQSLSLEARAELAGYNDVDIICVSEDKSETEKYRLGSLEGTDAPYAYMYSQQVADFEIQVLNSRFKAKFKKRSNNENKPGVRIWNIDLDLSSMRYYSWQVVKDSEGQEHISKINQGYCRRLL